MNRGGIAIYPRGKRLYVLYIDNINANTGMVYFQNKDFYRIIFDDGKYTLTKVNMKKDIPIGRKIDDLVYLELTKNLTSPYQVLSQPSVKHFLEVSGHRYDMWKELPISETMRIMIRKTLLYK